MDINSLEQIFYADSSVGFLVEIVLRTLVMFTFVLLVLRVSGRRGVKQLTIFDVAIILGLGSAAGDPMFQEDIPIVHGLTVFFVVVLFYRGVTWLASRSDGVYKILEGKPLVIVRDGEFTVTEMKTADFSQMEFFSELRNQSVEHLGQVRIAVLETDGSLSLLRYPRDQVLFGLPLFPDDYTSVGQETNDSGPFACMYCGRVKSYFKPLQICEKCGRDRWAKAKKST